MSRAIVVFVLFSVASAVVAQQPSETTGEERAAVLKYADPMTDNLLAGLNENDHAKYTKDFGPKMREVSTAQAFDALRANLLPKIGKYVSRKDPKVFAQQAFIIVVYDAKFEKEDSVAVRVVFPKSGDKKFVTGLWFDSPKLRPPRPNPQQ